jgi:hypothetical protein
VDPSKPELPIAPKDPVEPIEPKPTEPIEVTPLDVLAAGGTLTVTYFNGVPYWLMIVGDVAIPAVIIGTIAYVGGSLIVNGIEYNATHYNDVEMTILYGGPEAGYLYAKSQDSRLKTVASLIKVIQEHQGKINADPGSPWRPDWDKHIIKAINNLKKEIDKMGPATLSKALDLVYKAGIYLPK